MRHKNRFKSLTITLLFGFLAFSGLAAAPDTIPDLTKLTKPGDWLKLPSGKVIWVEMFDSEGESDEINPGDSLGLEAARRKSPFSCISPKFAGVVRRNAKTIPHKGRTRVFNTLDKMVAWLPSDSLMANHVPPIKRSSERVKEEQQNVEIAEAWLMAVYREEDNDFHVVLCNRPMYDSTALLFSVEVGGLPEEQEVTFSQFRNLKNTRTQITSRLGDLSCSKTFILREGMRVRVRGSLFFDSHHAGQVHGRKGLHPESAWEIHPVTRLIWLD